jgi:hypothetical protein
MAAWGWERAESFHKNNIIIFVSRSSMVVSRCSFRQVVFLAEEDGE